MKKIWAVIIPALLAVFSLVPRAQGTSDEKTIILTFDDGPNPSVLKDLLPLLKNNHAHASFFVIGSVAAKEQDWLIILAELGHTIENHSWGHENMKHAFVKGGARAVIHSLEKTAKIIQKTTRFRPKYFRPPFWEISEEIEMIARENGYEVMKLGSPDINSLDYEDAQKKRPASALVARVKNLVAAREKKGIFRHIFVFHELHLTVTALRELLPYFKKQGYEFPSLEKNSRFLVAQ